MLMVAFLSFIDIYNMLVFFSACKVMKVCMMDTTHTIPYLQGILGISTMNLEFLLDYIFHEGVNFCFNCENGWTEVLLSVFTVIKERDWESQSFATF